MANVEKYKLADAPRLLSHCAREMSTLGEHIHQERTPLNFNMAEGKHEGMTDYEYAKSRTRGKDIRRLNRSDVKDVCSWVVTMPRDLCHEAVDSDGNEYYQPNNQQECKDFFKYAYEFFAERHGEDNVISANVHMDENVPHMHFIFTPVVPDPEHDGLKVCAKEALHGCYGAKFQIELQDYISEKMGKELHMVRTDTVDYERNVKELKKKTLNRQCAYLSKEIAKAEEELERKKSALESFSRAVDAANSTQVKSSSSNGYTTLRDKDFKTMLQQTRYISAMKEEKKQLKKMLEEFERTNKTGEFQNLEAEAEELRKENSEMKKKLDHVDKFMESSKKKYGRDLKKDFAQFEKEQRKKEIEKERVHTWESERG